MKATFRLTRAKSDKPTGVFLDIRDNGKRKRWGTGISIHPELWNQEEQRAKPTSHYYNKHKKYRPGIDTFLDNTNTELEDILRSVNNYIRECSVQEKEANAEGLRKYLNDKIKGNVNKEGAIFLTEYFQDVYIPQLKSGKITYTRNNKRHKFAMSTIKVKEQSLNAFLEYEKENSKIRFEQIDQEFYEEFVNWHEAQDHSVNYIGKLIKELKVILRHTYEEGLHSNRIFESRHFVTLREDSKSVYLTKEELNKLSEYQLSGRDKHYRDMFLVGCYTALRFSDYSRLKTEHIKSSENGLYIDIITKKTGERVVIPVHPRIKGILSNQEYFNQKKVYEQKINKKIKTICGNAGIKNIIEVQSMKGGKSLSELIPKNKLITTHTARRTGASLMYLAKISSIDIMKITGHKTEKAFLKYIKVTKEETAHRLSSHPFFNE